MLCFWTEEDLKESKANLLPPSERDGHARNPVRLWEMERYF